MSEQAVKDPPAEAATEIPAATTHVEEGGPTSFKEAADRFFSQQQEVEDNPGEAAVEEIERLLNPPAEKKSPQEGQKPPEEAESKVEEPVEEVPEFGFDGERKEEPEKEALDEAAFDKETETQIQGLDPKAQDGWKKLRAQLKEAKLTAQQATDQTERMAALEKQAAEVEELRSRVEELTQADYVLKVQNSAEYREKVSAPVAEINRVVEQFSAAFEDLGQDKIMAAIREPDIVKRARLIEALSEDTEMPSMVTSELSRVSGIYHQVQASHERMLSNAETEWKDVQAKQEKEALRAAEEDRSLVSRHLDDNWQKARSLFNESDIKSAARRASSIDIRNESPANRAYAQMAGEAFPLALKEITRLRRELSKLGGESSRQKEASPNLSEGRKTDEQEADRMPKTFAEAMARMPDNLPL